MKFIFPFDLKYLVSIQEDLGYMADLLHLAQVTLSHRKHVTRSTVQALISHISYFSYIETIWQWDFYYSEDAYYLNNLKWYDDCIAHGSIVLTVYGSFQGCQKVFR